MIRETDPDVLHHRFDDERGDVAATQRGLERVGVVVRDDDRVGEHALRQTGGGRYCDRRVGRAGGVEGGLHRDHHLVVMTVIAAFDLHDLVATRLAARDADRVHRGLGTRVGEAPHRQPVSCGEQFRHDCIVLARRDEQRADIELRGDRVAHERMAVPGEQRAVAHVEIDIAVAVDILEPCVLGAGGDDRVRVVGLERRRDSERKALAGPIDRRL